MADIGGRMPGICGVTNMADIGGKMPGICGVTNHGRCWRRDARNLWRDQSRQMLDEGYQE